MTQDSTAKKAPRVIRKLRHWKQRFNENAAFIWRRSCTFGEVKVKAGDLVDVKLVGRVKIRRLWESHWIELAEFEEVNVMTGRPPEKPIETHGLEDVVDVQKHGGSWYTITYGDRVVKVRGKAKLDEALQELAKELAADADAEKDREAADELFALTLEISELNIPEDVSDDWTDEQKQEFVEFVTSAQELDEDAEAPEFLAEFLLDPDESSESDNDQTLNSGDD